MVKPLITAASFMGTNWIYALFGNWIICRVYFAHRSGIFIVGTKYRSKTNKICYVKKITQGNKWYSRNMGLLGTLILIVFDSAFISFLDRHLRGMYCSWRQMEHLYYLQMARKFIIYMRMLCISFGL